MPVLIEDLKNNKLYSKPVYLPSEAKNKKKGSVVFLMTPSYESSIKEMNLPYFLNNRRFESYYIEKDISFILSEGRRLIQNSDDIVLFENTMAKYRRITVNDKNELDKYDISYDDTLSDSFVGEIFVDYNNEYFGCLIMDAFGNTIYKVDSYSHQMKRDMIEYAIISFNPQIAKCWSKEDERLFAKYDFKHAKPWSNDIVVTKGARIIKEASSLAPFKLEAEIKIWQIQIAISEMVIKNFNNDNWMKHAYKEAKRKLNKIPLDGFSDDVDDTLESWRNKLNDQKATLNFYLSIKELELKDSLDLSEVVAEYVDWVDHLSCPKTLKLKIINEVISSYKTTIKECEFNLKRYRALDDSKKRLENGMALINKVFSIFSFIQGGPLSILKGTLLKSILPKTRKKNVLSEAELEAKIELYTTIVETLEEKKKEIQALEESSIMNILSESIISRYKKIELNNKSVLKYKEQAKYLCHFRTENEGNYKGYIWLDDDSVVGACSVDMNRKYIQAIEISDKYKGLGLSYDILRECVRLGARELSVSKTNDIAKHVYNNSGFKITSSTDSMDIMRLDESVILIEAKKPAYSRPYDRKEILDNYGKEVYDKLMKDPAHIFRADTGIELIHKEPSLEELKRIKRNWDMMSDSNKMKSDEMSRKLFGKDNETYYVELLSLYESSKNDNYIYCKTQNIHEGYSVSSLEEDILTDRYLQTENSITFLDPDGQILQEGDASYNGVLYKILYSERIKNRKEVMNLYDQVKEDCSFIKYTYANYDKYVGRNLFIDWSYYTKIFFKNNYKKLDKAIDLYVEFVTRFLDDNRLTLYSRKTIFIPVDDWIPNKDTSLLDYKKSINPISIIYRMIKRGDINKLKMAWGKYDIIFTTRSGYFKLNILDFEPKDLPRFMQNIHALVNKEEIIDDNTEPENSVGGIVNQVIDKLEDVDTIQINNLTGTTKSTPEEISKKINNSDISSEKKADTEEEVVDAITKAAVTSSSADEVMDKIDNDEYMKKLLIDLRNQSPHSVDISPTRVARIRELNDNFAKKKIADTTVGELLSKKEVDLPETSLPIDSINEEWKHLTFINHAKSYDLTADIVSCLHHFASTTEPVAIRDINVENTSTSEDWVDTWTVNCEDARGKRFTLKFDIPRLRSYRYMKLRGNDKTINGQLMNLPLIKTEESTCQMTTNYNKIFFSGYGTSTGKSYVVADRIIKTLTKNVFKSIEVQSGDNTRICAKYELPSDYIDLSSVFSKITVINKHVSAKYTFYFNQDELNTKYKDTIDVKQLAIGTVESSGSAPKLLYAKPDTPISFQIYELLCTAEGFSEVYDKTGISVRYTYSKASILNTKIPVAVIIGYYIGLIPMLDRAGIKYQVYDKRPKYDKSTQDIIRLSDTFIVYDLNYDSSMLLNGLKETDIAAYSLSESATKKMWLEFLDIFGGRIKADGLDMFYDLMIDPITKRVCNKYDLPTDFVDSLLYANMLLSDNKYNQHTNINGNRYRNIEIIAGYTYKALCNSYTQYRRDLRSGRDAKMTMKQSAVIDLMFADSTFGDLSALTDLLEVESAGTTSFKGLSGMNSERAYGLDKRTFDESMVNKLALSTGFAGNAGINRAATIDMDIESSMGYIKNTKIDDMSITKSFSMTEALTPFGTTSDDPFRSAMTFIQTSKHGMRVKISDPLLVTNGADEALPYMTSNTFTYKAKLAGKVIEKTDEYMVLEYKDKTTEVIDLRERILKNSDGGMYIAVQLSTDLKKGNIFKENEIVAADRSSYSSAAGVTDNIAYNIGTFVKFAIINSDEGYEDSCIETEWLSEAMSSVVVINKEYTLPKDTNVYFMAKKGQAIQEGEPLLIFQNAFDEEDANMLIKTLSEEDGEDIIAELGRIPIVSKVTGVVKDIKITRTVEKEDLSPSLLKIVNSYEKEVKSFNKVLDKYDKDKALTADATYKLEPTGKLKNAKDSVRIEFSLAYEDKFGVGDKTVCYSALKGVSKGVIPGGLEPFSQFRPEEKIHYIQSTNGDMKRMVGSILKIGAMNKVMVELGRSVCDIMGIKWKYFDEY